MRSRLTALALVLVASFAPAQQADQPVQDKPTIALLERYAAGEFDAVVGVLNATTDFEQILDELKKYGPHWITFGGTADKQRRAVAIATFALEAARVASWREWKWLIKPPPGVQGLPAVYWKPAPLLIEWACEIARLQFLERGIERIWHIAAVSVATHAEDQQFLVGNIGIEGVEPPPVDPNGPKTPFVVTQSRASSGQVAANVKDEIAHLQHARDRFPTEMRFILAEGIARSRRMPGEAIAALSTIVNDPDVGGEARMRLGELWARGGRTSAAMEEWDRAERQTRDPYVIYLVHFLRGQALLRQKRETAAIDAFRAALSTRPGTQSASVALAELLFKAGNRAEAQHLMVAILEAPPGTTDPYLEFVHGDDRFWPELLARLRKVIKP